MYKSIYTYMCVCVCILISSPISGQTRRLVKSCRVNELTALPWRLNKGEGSRGSRELLRCQFPMGASGAIGYYDFFDLS